jgi:predicted ribosome quality control (RQC) complex YloA/Tae2 family protein
MASNGRVYRQYDLEGFEVLVGRGDAENDTLTLRLAEPHDFWLHVSGTPGSHVVVRNPARLEALPPRIAELAAQLAVWHSKSRGARGKVAVHLCQASEVSKRRGQPAGEVLLRRFTTVRVYSRPPAEAQDEAADVREDERRRQSS